MRCVAAPEWDMAGAPMRHMANITAVSSSTSERQTKPVTARRFALLAIGYGLYRSLMNLSYSTAMSTVPGTYPLGTGNLDFSLSVSLSIMLCSALLAIANWQRPSLHLSIPGIIATVTLAGINLCSGLGLFSSLSHQTALLFLSFVYGTAAICANTAWLVPFASLGPRPCLTALAASVLVGALATSTLGALPVTAQCFALAVTGLASTACLAVSGRENNPHAANSHAAPGKDACKQTFSLLAELWSPLVVYASLTMLTGFVTAFLSTETEPDGTGPVSNVAQIAGALLVAAVAFALNRTFDLRKTFQRAFPVIALLLVVLPFTGRVYGTVFCATLAFLNSVVNVSMLFLLIETARVRNAPVIAVTCLTMFLARPCLALSLLIGRGLGTQGSFDDLVRALMVAVTAIYLLSMTLVVLVSRRQDVRTGRVAVPLSSSQITFNTPDPMQTGTASPATITEQPASNTQDERDSLERRIAQLSARAHLTPREQEVILLLAQGRTAPRIAEELGLATNTVRSYTQEAYAKLDVHSKQELIDLLTCKEADTR